MPWETGSEHEPSPVRAKHRAWAPCAALSGLGFPFVLKPRATLRVCRRYALPWADLFRPLRGGCLANRLTPGDPTNLSVGSQNDQMPPHRRAVPQGMPCEPLPHWVFNLALTDTWEDRCRSILFRPVGLTACVFEQRLQWECPYCRRATTWRVSLQKGPDRRTGTFGQP